MVVLVLVRCGAVAEEVEGAELAAMLDPEAATHSYERCLQLTAMRVLHSTE